MRKHKKGILKPSESSEGINTNDTEYLVQGKIETLWKSHNHLSQSQPDYVKVKKKQEERRGNPCHKSDYFEESTQFWKHQRHKNKSNKQKIIFDSAYL
jgi:hypothetical protein